MRLDVLTPRGPLLSRDVDEVSAPGVLGEFGVLPGHIPFLTGLRAGVVRYESPSGNGRLAIGPGFAEVSEDRVSILVETGAEASSIDAIEAENEMAEVQKQLDAWHSDDEGALAHLRARLDWAQARLEALR